MVCKRVRNVLAVLSCLDSRTRASRTQPHTAIEWLSDGSHLHRYTCTHTQASPNTRRHFSSVHCYGRRSLRVVCKMGKHTEIHIQIDLSNGKNAAWRKSRKTKLKINKVDRVDFHLEAETSTVISWLQSKRSKLIKWMRVLINVNRLRQLFRFFYSSFCCSAVFPYKNSRTQRIVSYWKSRKIQCGNSEQCFQVIHRVYIELHRSTIRMRNKDKRGVNYILQMRLVER